MTSVEKINLGAEGHENRRRISYEVKRQFQVPSYQLIPEMEFGSGRSTRRNKLAITN